MCARFTFSQVVSANRLDLAPRLAAPTGRVRRHGVLDDDALVARAQRLIEDPLSLTRIRGEDGGDLQVRRDRLKPARTDLQRRVEQGLAVEVQQVEEERHDPLRRCVAVDLRHRVLKRRGTAVGHPQRFAIEYRLPYRQSSHRRHDPRQRVGDVVEVARVNAHLITTAMDLDADPIELPLDGRQPKASHRLRHIASRRGEHRQDWPEDLKADVVEPLLAARHRDLGRRREVSGEHQRPSRDLA